MEKGEFNSDDHDIHYCGQESLRRNGVGPIVNKSPKCSTLVPPNHIILCHPLLVLPSIYPSIRVFSVESVLHIR